MFIKLIWQLVASLTAVRCKLWTRWLMNFLIWCCTAGIRSLPNSVFEVKWESVADPRCVRGDDRLNLPVRTISWGSCVLVLLCGKTLCEIRVVRMIQSCGIWVAFWRGLDLCADCKGCPWLLAHMLPKLKGENQKGKTAKLKATFQNWNRTFLLWHLKKVESWGKTKSYLRHRCLWKEISKKRELVAGLFKSVLVILKIVLTGKEGMQEMEKRKKMLGYYR